MIFSVTNQKGGVGKTTTVLNIGVFIAIKGKKVLLVDSDPQSNLTSGLGVRDPEDKAEFRNIYDVLVNKVSVKDVIRKSRIEGLDVLPSGIELAGAEVELVGAMSRENILKNALKEVYDEYDYIIIDSPPSLGLLTINSLVACDFVLIPVQAEYFALEGLGQLVNTVKLIKTNLNPAMEVGGVILTMYDYRTNLSKDVAGELANFFQAKVFKTVIPRNIKLSEAPSHGLSIYEFAPISSGGQAYQSLSDEIIERFDKSALKRPNLSKSA